MSERGKDPLDIILWMTKVSTDGPFYKVELEITGGAEAGKITELTAPVYNIGSNKYIIVERKVDLVSGEVQRIPILATYMPKGTVKEGMEAETAVRAMRRSRKMRGTRRTGLGHV